MLWRSLIWNSKGCHVVIRRSDQSYSIEKESEIAGLRQLGVLKTCIQLISMMGHHQFNILVFVRHTTSIHSNANFSDDQNYKICCPKRVEIARCFGAENICSMEKRSTSVTLFTIIPDVPRWRKRKIENSMFLLLFRFRCGDASIDSIRPTRPDRCSSIQHFQGVFVFFFASHYCTVCPAKWLRSDFECRQYEIYCKQTIYIKENIIVLVAGRVVTSHIVEWKIFIFILIESINK